jgi:hypothetical protein
VSANRRGGGLRWWVPAAVSLVAACAQVLGVDGTVVVGGTTACGITAGSSSCATCLRGACCDVAQACASNAACAAYEDCLVPCQEDYACRARCTIAHGVNDEEVAELDQCLDAQCQSACGVTCGEVNVPAPPDAATACANCITEWACPQGNACGKDLGCHLITQCVLSCATLDCQAACVTDADAGVVNFVGVVNSAQACYQPCQSGTNWTCLGKRSLPLTSQPQSSVTVALITPGGAPVAGATVTACEPTDDACAMSFGTGTTDATGQVTLSLPEVVAGGVGFFGYFEISGPSIASALFFLGAPLSARAPVVTIPTSNPQSFEVGAAGVGVTWPDTTHGSLVVFARDCDLVAAPNVVVSVDAASDTIKTFYVAGSALSPAATSTDTSGVAMAFDLPADHFTLTVTPLAEGSPSSQLSLFARTGWISMVYAVPNVP